MSERDVLLAKHNFNDLKIFANNAKIKSSKNFYLYGMRFIGHFIGMHINIFEGKTISFSSVK